MKVIQKSFLVIMSVLLIESCTKKEMSPPSKAETNAGILAGANGSSKKWKLYSISESINGGAAQSVDATSGIPGCESDNIFQFSNNSTQTYTQTEGATACNIGQTDPNTIESGSWAFTDDGKSLLIDAVYYPTSAQFQNETPNAGYFLDYFILSIGKPLAVTQITATSFTVTYSGTYVDSNNVTNTYVDTLVFKSTN